MYHITIYASDPKRMRNDVLDCIRDLNCPKLNGVLFLSDSSELGECFFSVSSIDERSIEDYLAEYPVETWYDHNGMKTTRPDFSIGVFYAYIDGHYYCMITH